MVMEQHEYKTKLRELLDVVFNAKDIKVRSELYKIYRNVSEAYDNLDRESVECRRLGKTTAKYVVLEQKLNESTQEFEQWITYATLLYT